MVLRCVLFAAALTLGIGCGPDDPPPQSPTTQVRRRAGVDFDCPLEDIKVTKLDERTRVARGCGQTATYIRICDKCQNVGASVLVSAAVSDDCRCT